MRTLTPLYVLVLAVACGSPPPVPKEPEVTAYACLPPPDSCFCENGERIRAPNCEIYPMAETIHLTATSLWTTANEITGRPRGALSVANNVEVYEYGKMRPIRGQRAREEAPSGGGYLFGGVTYQGADFEHYSSGAIERWSGGAYTRLQEDGEDAVVFAPFGYRMRWTQAESDLYVTTLRGLRVVDGLEGQLAIPGVPRAGGAAYGVFSGGLIGTSGFLPPGASVAYRTTLVRNDAEGKPQISAPGGRYVVTNTAAGTRNTWTYWLVPKGARAGDIAQVYRTAVAPENVAPGDDMRQVAEFALTQLDINNGYYVYEDATVDVARQAFLYTNALQQGATQANERPPMGVDVVTFNRRLWVANVTRPHRFTFRMLAPPEPGDIITVNGRDYYAVAVAADYGAREFNVSTDGTVAQNIERTALEFITAVTMDGGNETISAAYQSGENDPPGMILFESTEVGGPPFAVKVSDHAERYIPDMKDPVASTAERLPHALVMSKDGLPYAFPAESNHTVRVGSADKEIARAVAVNGRIIVWKVDDGIWVIYGDSPGNFGVDQIAPGTHILAPESVQVIGNVAYGLTNKGVVAVSEAGVEVISPPIEDVFRTATFTRDSRETVWQATVGVSYQSGTEVKYHLFLPEPGGTDTFARQGYTFNASPELQAWTRRADDYGEATGAYVDSEGRLVVGNNRFAAPTVELKSGTASDYVGLNVEMGLYFNAPTGNRFSADELDRLREGYSFLNGEGLVAARVVRLGESTIGEDWFEVDNGDAMRALFDGAEWANLTFVDGLPISFGWNVDSVNAPQTPKIFGAQTLQFGENHSRPWEVTWTSDLGYVSSLEAFPDGRQYATQWVHEDVASTTRLGTVWNYVVGGEVVTILGMTSEVEILSGGSNER